MRNAHAYQRLIAIRTGDVNAIFALDGGDQTTSRFAVVDVPVATVVTEALVTHADILATWAQ